MALTARERRAAAENAAPEEDLAVPRPRTSSRSPHPYHRRGSSLLEQDHIFNSPANDSSDRSITKITPRSSSDSGSEADNEGAAVLKGLPAPPSRPRKGLKVSKDGVNSPLVTPSQFEDEPRKWSLQASRKAPSTPSADIDAETQRIREKYTRRKRAEIIRRVSETALLLVVGLTVCSDANVRRDLRNWRQELACFFGVVFVLLLSYPARVIRSSRSISRTWHFQIPATFDPAPLLYPIFMPPLIASSLAKHTSNFILPNLLLGLSSLPPPLIPYYTTSPCYSPIHWAIASLPLILSQNSLTYQHPSKPLALKSPVELLDPEVLVLVFPLQQTLLPTIEFLTTTSLLPAELHLLSTALINLFLFARSPESEILKALLWVGGVSIFISCRHVLQWEVALARVPSWRLRRSQSQRQPERSLLVAFDNRICQALSRLNRGSIGNDSSDSDAPNGTIKVPRRNGRLRGLKIETSTSQGDNAAERPMASAADETGKANMSDIRDLDFAKLHKRRHTFTTFEDVFRPPPRTKTTPSGRPKRSITPNAQSFLSLTPAQAQVRKWLYAICAYIAAITTIFVPVRRYVSVRALNGRDPMGWALGYLLGDIPMFRDLVVSADLQRWIILPPEDGDAKSACHLGTVEHLRQDTFGEANTRLVLCAYCGLILIVGMAIVLQLSAVVEVDTRRKVFHGMMVAMFLPTVFVDPAFTALAMALILAVFLLLDLFRASQLPPLTRPLTHFLAPYVDGRDHRGPVIVSHIFLLIGCAIPLWLSLAGAAHTGKPPWEGWDIEGRDLSMVSGVICVGMGDAAASLFGRRYGRHKWLWAGGKSLEGSFAFAAVVTMGLMAAHTWKIVGDWTRGETKPWLWVSGRAAVAASGASLTESILTGANDNVVVPLMLWLLVRGLGL